MQDTHNIYALYIQFHFLSGHRPVSGNTVEGRNTHMYYYSFHNSPETFTHTVLFLTYIHT